MNRALRILIVSAAYRPYPSGVSEHVHYLALNLKKLGHQVHVLTTRFPKFEHLTEKDAVEIPVHRIGQALLVPLNRSYATLPVGLRIPFQIAKFIRAHKFDIIHCHGVFWPEISYWAIHYSNTINVVTFLTAGFRIHSRGKRLFQLIFRNHLKKIHGRIAISQRARAAIEPYIPGDYRIIPSGVDLERFRPGLAPLPEKKTTTPRILFLGRLDERKGIDVLINAIPLIRQTIPDIKVIVVGKGPMERKSRALVEKLGLNQTVQFVGPAKQSEIPRYYCGCDVYCSPALGGETQGVVLLEAMACGVPAVASSIPGYDETIHDGVNGILFPPGDIKALSRAIIKVINNAELRNKLIEGGLNRVKEYAWPVIARKTLDYYCELTANFPHRLA